MAVSIDVMFAPNLTCTHKTPHLRPYLADLHVHTVLSPCAEVEMIPPLIVKRAGDLALGIIAITDHNSAENVAAVIEAAQGFDLTVLPGMEVQTYAHLPPLKNNAKVFGPQFVVDATGDFIRYNDRLLATSTSLSVEEVTGGVEAKEGLCIAAHIDRPSFSLLANLGFVPQGVRFAAMEITHNANADQIRHQHPSLAGYSFVCSGDAHRLGEMSNKTILTLSEPTITEISMAFRGQAGRKVKVVEDEH